MHSRLVDIGGRDWLYAYYDDYATVCGVRPEVFAEDLAANDALSFGPEATTAALARAYNFLKPSDERGNPVN